MGLIASIGRWDRYRELASAARHSAEKREQARRILTEAAMNGDGTAAKFAGDVAQIEPADFNGALYWYELAARLAVNPWEIADIASQAARPAMFIANEEDPDACGPASVRAMAWLRIAMESSPDFPPEVMESHWRDMVDGTAIDTDDIRDEVRRIAGGPRHPHHMH